jgi:hypothetical protein
MRPPGSSLVEAVVAAALAGVALIGLVTSAHLAATGLRLARDSAVALAFASERLELLRGAPAGSGSERRVAGDGTVFTQSWTAVGGRGGALDATVHTTWDTHAFTLAGGAPP